MDYNEFIDANVVEGNIQELGDLSGPKGLTYPHLAEHVVCNFYIFTKRLYSYMVLYLQRRIEATCDVVLSAKLSFATPNFSLAIVHTMH